MSAIALPTSAILFGLALACVQGWLLGLRLPSVVGFLWLVINTAGIILALVITAAILSPLLRLLPLDVLQNKTHGAIALGLGIALFVLLMTLLQWSVLRRRVDAPLLRALLNIIIGGGIWFGLTVLFPADASGNFSRWLLAAALLLGAVCGALLERTVSFLQGFTGRSP